MTTASQKLAVLADLIQVYVSDGGDPIDLCIVIDLLKNERWRLVLAKIARAGTCALEPTEARTSYALIVRGLVEKRITKPTSYRLTEAGDRIAAAFALPGGS